MQQINVLVTLGIIKIQIIQLIASRKLFVIVPLQTGFILQMSVYVKQIQVVGFIQLILITQLNVLLTKKYNVVIDIPNIVLAPTVV
jgi:hypothetical protein